MDYLIEPCTESDFNGVAVANVIFNSFNNNSPIQNAIHPGNMTPAGRERAMKIFRTLGKASNLRWMKAVTTDGQIVGIAQYNLYDFQGTGEKLPITDLKVPEGNWEEEDDQYWANAMFRSLLQQRNLVLSEKPGKVVLLSKMCVIPEYQRKGVGTTLMRWGCDFADGMKAEMIVDSTPEGLTLYKQHGFVAPNAQMLELNVPEKYGNRPKQRLCFMRREVA